MDFNEDGEKATVSDLATLDFVSNLLGVPSHMLKNALEVRVVETKHGGNRGTHYNVPLNKTQAVAGRDALAKALYDRLFTVSFFFSCLLFIIIIIFIFSLPSSSLMFFLLPSFLFLSFPFLSFYCSFYYCFLNENSGWLSV